MKQFEFGICAGCGHKEDKHERYSIRICNEVVCYCKNYVDDDGIELWFLEDGMAVWQGVMGHNKEIAEQIYAEIKMNFGEW